MNRSNTKKKNKLANTASQITYEVINANLNSHIYTVICRVECPNKDQIINFPQWIVGSYMIRDFAKNLQNLQAIQNNKTITFTQLTKSSWKLHCTEGHALSFTYKIYAHDASVRGAWLDQSRAFFNGTSLFFEIDGHLDSEYLVRLNSMLLSPSNNQFTEEWRVFTQLDPVKVNKDGWGLYKAQSFQTLADSPVLIGAPWVGEFKVRDITHRFVITGTPPSFDGNKLLTHSQKICETVIDFWHPSNKPAIDNYLFILNASQDGYGGLEHKNSTVLQCKRADLPNIHKSDLSDGYIGLLGLISHEYFHTWNVKRLRPTEFTHYKFDTENYTELLWLFEGFTSYYDDLLLRRSGLINDLQYLKLVNKNIQQVLQTPGRFVQSVAQSSFDAWVKYYKPDENTPNSTVSYYSKGALIALCFDLKLRSFKSSLDEVMRELYKRSKGGPIGELEFAQVLNDLSGYSWRKEIKSWVHGIMDPPFEELLLENGIQVLKAPDPLQLQLGIRTDDSKSNVHIKHVLSNGIAERSGFVPGDEWIGVEVSDTAGHYKKSRKSNPIQSQSWRLSKLDDLWLLLGNTKKFVALVGRDQRIIRLLIDFDIDKVNSNKSNCTLSIKNGEKATKWLLNV